MQKSRADLHLLVVDPLPITLLSETEKHKDFFMIFMWNINLVNNDISSDSFLKHTSCFIERNKLNWKSRITFFKRLRILKERQLPGVVLVL